MKELPRVSLKTASDWLKYYLIDGTSQYNAAKMTGLNIDEISEQFSNLETGVDGNAASDENIVNLNSNFRSYLVLHPISEADRESFKFIQRINNMR